MICIFGFIWILFEFVVLSRIDFDDSGELDPSENLESQDFNEGKLYPWPYCPSILKLFNSVFKLLLHAYFYSIILSPYLNT